MDQSESNTKEGLHPNLHPLLIPLVLEKVFNHLSLPDLINCASVCKLWCGEAIKARCIRRNAEIFCQEGILDLEKEILNNPNNKLINKLTTFNVNLDGQNFQRLLERIAATLSELIIDSVDMSMQTFYDCLRTLRNLVKLEIEIIHVDNGILPYHHKLFPIYETAEMKKKIIFNHMQSLELLTHVKIPLKALLHSFPNLKSLTMTEYFVEPSFYFEIIEMPYLEELRLACRIDNPHLKMLASIKFPRLNKLVLCHLKSNLNIKLFKKFIERHNETLQTLNLHYFKTSDNEPRLIDIFPLDLPNLLSLRVDKIYVMNMSRLFKNLPKLAELDLWPPKYNWLTKFPKSLKQQPQLNSLGISWIKPKSLKVLANVFSSLNFLTIQNCDDTILRMIFTHMPQLKTLWCSSSLKNKRRITTEVLTGIHPNIFSYDMRNPVAYRTNRPYIAKMTRLNSLKITFSPRLEPCFIKAIFEYGIPEVPLLNDVKIYGFKIDDSLSAFLEGYSGGYTVSVLEEEDDGGIFIHAQVTQGLPGHQKETEDV